MASETKQAIIITAWPCVGKTFFAVNNAKEECPPIHLDSSAYDLKSSAGTEKYVEHIESEARGSPNSILLVSSHAEVRELLRRKGLKYVAVSVNHLEDWKKRQLRRLNDDPEHKNAHQGLLKKGIAEWDTWKAREAGEKGAKIVLGNEEYLSDIGVEQIHNLWKAYL
ncbi:hypothetical protein DHEL01_v209900 [Diaporthe helianthi]|uniref:Uncharacterized protein n=1 Tax=Diaporthe helianthi TaxID=158607 RepID=A0A2P5HN74_DIAHE|nr:hypothetical protein DHEL01_v209900 [Diaporthe helianthi]